VITSDQQRQRSDGRAHECRGQQRGEQAADPRDARERSASPRQATKQRGGDDDLERISERLSDGGADRQRRIVVDKQIAYDDGGQETEAQQVEPGDADPDGKPHDCRDRAGELECVADVRGRVIGGDQADERENIATVDAQRAHRGSQPRADRLRKDPRQIYPATPGGGCDERCGRAQRMPSAEDGIEMFAPASYQNQTPAGGHVSAPRRD
jgi:hypothetical protein